MGGKTAKTNAARLLDKAGIEYELIPYTVDEENLAATHVAEQLGEPICQVFKTLVLRGDRTGLFVCVIPGDGEIDLKKAAAIDGLYTRRLFAYRHEEAAADIHTPDSGRLSAYLHQCRSTRVADKDCP